jgi:hypothetical protein
MSTSTSDFRERAAQRNDARNYDSTPSLLRRLMDDVGVLFTQELALLKSETSRSIGDMKAAVVSVAMGGAVLMIGIIFLALAGVYALGTVVDLWLAALIVGGGITLVGAIMLLTGRRKLQPAAMAPRRTADALRKDATMLKGVSQHEQH